MLTCTAAKTRVRPRKPRVGLALAGGGPLGGVFEIGALRAVNESLEGVEVSRLDAFVGVSSGAFLAAGLANRVTIPQMHRIFIQSEAIGQLFAPEVFSQPAITEVLNRARALPLLLAGNATRCLQSVLSLSLAGCVTGLGRAMPAGVFDNEAIHEFLSRVYRTFGATNDFRELKQRLFIVAVDLDTSESVRFGSPGYDHVPISRAIQASSALPGLYPPVEIDGRFYVDGVLRKTLHASALLEEGVDLLLCVNPLVPYHSREKGSLTKGEHERLVDGGLPVVLSQTLRTLIRSRMEAGMAHYTNMYPETDVVLFEPNPDDPEVFFANAFSYANRRRVCEHAYQTVRRDLLSRRWELEAMLDRHGITLRVDLLEDENRSFETGLAKPSERLELELRRADVVLEKLGAALDRLETHIDAS